MAEINVKKNEEVERIDVKDMTKKQCLEIIKGQSETIEKCKETIHKMYSDLQSLSNDRIFTRLEFLFRVLDHSDDFDFKPYFVQECKDEIISLIEIKKNKDGK